MTLIDKKPVASLLITALTLGFGSILIHHSNIGKYSCRVRIENPHISTSILRNEGKEALKINVKTECDIAQIKATVWVELFENNAGKALVIQRFNPVTQTKDLSPYVIEFKGIYRNCENKSPRKYFATVRTKIELINGVAEQPQNVSSLSGLINCGFKR